MNSHLLVPADESQRQRRGITSLNMAYVTAPEAGAGLYRFLELIGSSLTRLQLSSLDLDIDIARVMQACPNLETLIVHDIEVSAKELVDAYRINDSRISEIECCVDNLSTISRELMDAKTTIAQTLKRFVYEQLHENAILRDEVESFVQMLCVNKRLEFVSMTGNSNAVTWAAHLYSARNTHCTTLPVAQTPFPLSCRLAFLSLFNKFQPNNTKRSKTESVPLSPAFAKFAVDRHLISIIFAYAAERVLRRVHFIAKDTQ